MGERGTLAGREADGAQGLGAVELQMYAAALRRYFRKRVPHAEVDDLVQEVFLNLQARRAEIPIQNLGGYLFAVAGHVLLHYRTQQRKTDSQFQGIDDDATLYASMDPSPERVVSSREELQRFVAALEYLPPRTRDVFVLHRFEEMTYPAIASCLHISVSAVEKQIMNALRMLRDELEKDR
jgi:RNA polymerase sigma factor (sigma-70 family)